MKSKQYYIDVYNQAIEDERQLCIKENGNDYYFEWDDSFIDTAEEIVGYYLVRHSEEPLETWLYNLENSRCKWTTDDEVTKILTELFS